MHYKQNIQTNKHAHTINAHIIEAQKGLDFHFKNFKFSPGLGKKPHSARSSAATICHQQGE